MFDSGGLEVLSRDECLRLLGSVPVGRIVFTDRALPAVAPVVFAVDGTSLVMRISEGSAVLAARDAIVAFEVDQLTGDMHAGWCVTVVGHAAEVNDPDRLRCFGQLGLPSPREGERARFLAVAVEIISGRRIPNSQGPN
jgi:hypothetical protein